MSSDLTRVVDEICEETPNLSSIEKNKLNLKRWNEENELFTKVKDIIVKKDNTLNLHEIHKLSHEQIKKVKDKIVNGNNTLNRHEIVELALKYNKTVPIIVKLRESFIDTLGKSENKSRI
jgi:hypothetical protein